MQPVLSILGRLLISAIFFLSGLHKLADTEKTVAAMEAHNIPLSGLLVYAAAALEIVGALMVALGFKARFGAMLLIVFLIPTTFIFHPPFADPMQQIQFLKNLSILGGLVLILRFGSGDLSIKA